jgi:hypothetical protein
MMSCLLLLVVVELVVCMLGGVVQEAEITCDWMHHLHTNFHTLHGALDTMPFTPTPNQPHPPVASSSSVASISHAARPLSVTCPSSPRNPSRCMTCTRARHSVLKFARSVLASSARSSAARSSREAFWLNSANSAWSLSALYTAGGDGRGRGGGGGVGRWEERMMLLWMLTGTSCGELWLVQPLL